MFAWNDVIYIESAFLRRDATEFTPETCPFQGLVAQPPGIWRRVEIDFCRPAIAHTSPRPAGGESRSLWIRGHCRLPRKRRPPGLARPAANHPPNSTSPNESCRIDVSSVPQARHPTTFLTVGHRGQIIRAAVRPRGGLVDSPSEPLASLSHKEATMGRTGRILKAFIRARYCLGALSLLWLANAGPAGAFNYVTDANGTLCGIQDAASPGVDTGSIRTTQTGPGDCLFNPCVTPPYSTSINGFGGIKVLVQTTPPPRFNAELMRGFGLTFD